MPWNTVRVDAPRNLTSALNSFDDLWSPRIVTRINDYDVRVAKTHGDHVWHVHEDSDELFLVWRGQMVIQMEGRPDVIIGPGEFFVVPRGVEHRPVAEAECEVLLLEPAGLVNTGEAEAGDMTAPNVEWM